MNKRILIVLLFISLAFVKTYSQENDNKFNCLTSLNGLTTDRDASAANFAYNRYGELLSILYITSNKATGENRMKYTYTYEVTNKRIIEAFENWKDNQWVPQDRLIYSLDDNKNVTQLLENIFVNNEYVDKLVSNFTYDKFQNINTITFKRVINNEMQNSQYSYFGYNDDNQLVYYSYKNWYNNKWNEVNKCYYHYDERNVLTKTVCFSYQNDYNIENFEYLKTEKIYSSSGKILSSYSVIKTKDSLSDYRKIEYKYDENDNLIKKSYYNKKDNDWECHTVLLYEYDYYNNLTSTVYKALKDDKLIPFHRSDYAYDSHKNKIMEMYSEWENETWIKYTLTTYNYDNDNNLIVKILQNWKDNQWENYSRLSYEYNNSHNMTKGYAEIWYNDGLNEKEWMPQNFTFQVNVSNKIINNFSKKRHHNRKFALHVKAFEINLQYQDITSVNNIKYDKINISPNPAEDYIDIAIADDRTPKNAVKVYDILGNVVLTLTPTLSLKGEGVKVDVSGLPAGVYFVRVGGKMYKFVKI